MHPPGKFSKSFGLLTLGLLFVAPSSLYANEQVYQNILPGTVWVKANLGAGKVSFGSGALVDEKRKWVVTNVHVVDNQNQVTVFFPSRKKDEVIAEKLFYVVNEPKMSLTGRVIFRDAKRDIAIIELPQLPEDAKAIKIAPKAARQGQLLHVVGNPNGPALWVYSSGTVRSVYNKNWTAMTGDGKPMFLQARVVETQIPINPGDSGGPVVNDASELVAIVSSYNKVQQLVSTCIDVSEVKTAMQRAEKGDSGDTIVVNNPQFTGPIQSTGPLPPGGGTGPLPPGSGNGPVPPTSGPILQPRRIEVPSLVPIQPSALQLAW